MRFLRDKYGLNFVESADEEANRYIREVLEKALPDWDFKDTTNLRSGETKINFWGLNVILL